LKLLHVIGTLDPTYGGPVAAATQLAVGCAELGVDAELVTLDAPNDPWLETFSGVVHALGPSLGRYRYCPALRPWLDAHCRDYDAVIVHGVWQYQSAAVHAVCRPLHHPYFVFVHGALDPWFRSRYPLKHLKKQSYWLLIEHRVLRDARAVLFTCDEERRLAAQSFRPFRCSPGIVPLGVADPPSDRDEQVEAFLRAHGHLAGARFLLFLSRVHPKKGCDLLIKAFAGVSSKDERLRLVIAGPDEDGWSESLANLARSLGVADRITWTGMLTGDEKWGAYRAADAFVLPSHSENFGVVVAEALACGLPVLLSNKVNIWREVAAAGAGLVEDDSLRGTCALLERWVAQTASQTARMRERARDCYESSFEIGAASRAFAEFIEQKVAVRSSDVAGQRSRARSNASRGRTRLGKLARLLGDDLYRSALLRHGVPAGVEHEVVLRGLGCRTVVDVGANRGQFALCARRCFPDAEIVSVEPLPGPGDRFRRVFRGDSRVVLHEAAIGPRSGRAAMHVSRRDDSSSLLPITPRQSRTFPGTQEVGTTIVREGRLSEFVSEGSIRQPALLKLDVQGYELEALKGCSDLLRHFEWIYVECSFAEFYEGQVLGDDLFVWLQQQGYASVELHGQVFDDDGAILQADALFRRVRDDEASAAEAEST
jgi:FkbM family methyltransferase